MPRADLSPSSPRGRPRPRPAGREPATAAAAAGRAGLRRDRPATAPPPRGQARRSGGKPGRGSRASPRSGRGPGEGQRRHARRLPPRGKGREEKRSEAKRRLRRGAGPRRGSGSARRGRRLALPRSAGPLPGPRTAHHPPGGGPRPPPPATCGRGACRPRRSPALGAPRRARTRGCTSPARRCQQVPGSSALARPPPSSPAGPAGSPRSLPSPRSAAPLTPSGRRLGPISRRPRSLLSPGPPAVASGSPCRAIPGDSLRTWGHPAPRTPGGALVRSARRAGHSPPAGSRG